MAASLKLCLMIHVEDGKKWTPIDSDHRHEDPWAERIGLLAKTVGSDGRGAKLSVQFDRPYLDQNWLEPPAPLLSYLPPTSLSIVLEKGGNFWCHTHSATYAHLHSTFTCVASAVAGELGGIAFAVATPMVGGRSGGGDLDEPSIDPISITQALGLRLNNSSVFNQYAALPESLRPYGATDNDIRRGVYFHVTAPGPLYPGAPTTMRQRPFWMNSATQWDTHVDCIYPHEDFQTNYGSVMMIPHLPRGQIHEYEEARCAATMTTLTVADFDGALTEIWTTYQYMVNHQNSITNVWYVKIPLVADYFDAVDTFGAWVDSVNELMAVNDVPPLACWMNMNEIASVFCDPNSFNY